MLSPRLLALVLRERRLAGGEVGALDGDPICDCQDWQIRRVRIGLQWAGAHRAVATVRFLNTGRPQTIRLDLLAIDGRWRIDNIHSKSIPDLVAFLRRHAGGR